MAQTHRIVRSPDLPRHRRQRTSANHNKAETTEGIVTLSGLARNAAEKDLVTKLVTDINGVKSVANNKTIDESHSEKN